MSKYLLLVLAACTNSPDSDKSLTGDTSNDTSEEEIPSLSGHSFAVNSCKYLETPVPSWTFDIGLVEPVCGAEDAEDFYKMTIEVYPNEMISGQTLRVNPYDPTIDAGEAFATWQISAMGFGTAISGSVVLTFDGEWIEGVEYTGTYSFETEHGEFVSGEFNGIHCGGEHNCE